MCIPPQQVLAVAIGNRPKIKVQTYVYKLLCHRNQDLFPLATGLESAGCWELRLQLFSAQIKPRHLSHGFRHMCLSTVSFSILLWISPLWISLVSDEEPVINIQYGCRQEYPEDWVPE